jgi:hypothetical protein
VTQVKGTLMRGVALAAVVGLFPLVLQTALFAIWPTGAEHQTLTRLEYVVVVPATPGRIVGGSVIGALDGFGLVQHVDWSYDAHQWEHPPGNDGHAVGWRLARRIESIACWLGNMVIFGTLWFMLRSGPKRSWRRRVAVGVIAVWLIVMVPAAIFGSMWMVL